MKRMSFENFGGKESKILQLFTKRLRNFSTVMLAVLLVCCAATVFVVRAYTTRLAKPSSAIEAASAVNPAEPAQEINTSQKIPKGVELRVQNITLTEDGFQPSRITRPAGWIVLAIDNYLGDIALQLDPIGGSRVYQRQMLARKRFARDPLNLTPGEYVLTDANHPGLECRITVTAQ